MPDLAYLDPQTDAQALAWVMSREFPLERAIRVQRLLHARLANRGFADVDVSFDDNGNWRIRMTEGTSDFGQLYEIGEFVFEIVYESGNRIVRDWIPDFQFDPGLELKFRLVEPVK